MRIYLASPFFNPAQLALVQDLERIIESFINLDLYSPRRSGITIKDLPPTERNRLAQQVFQTNVDEIDKADLLLAVIDGRDSGTIFEMGYAHGKAKPIITYSDAGYGVNVMLAGCVLAHMQGKKDAIHMLASLANEGLAALVHYRSAPLVTT